MEKSSSNKALIITLIICMLLIVVYTFASQGKKDAEVQEKAKELAKTMNKQGTQIVQPKPDMKEATYSSITSTANGKKVVTLSLQGTDAKMSTVFMNGEPAVVEWGSYTRSGNYVTVLLVDRNGQKMESPIDLTFENVNKSTLKLVNPDQENYGSASLNLVSDSNSLAGTSWYWKETLMNNDEKTAPTDSTKFKLTFTTATEFGTTTDCNSGSGTYFASNGQIAFGPVASTKMFCQDSLETEYFKDLGEVESYMTKDNQLIMMFPVDSGSMIFEKAE